MSLPEKEIKSIGFIYDLHKVLKYRLSSTSFDDFYINFYVTYAQFCRGRFKNDNFDWCIPFKGESKRIQNQRILTDYYKMINKKKDTILMKNLEMVNMIISVIPSTFNSHVLPRIRCRILAQSNDRFTIGQTLLQISIYVEQLISILDTNLQNYNVTYKDQQRKDNIYACIVTLTTAIKNAESDVLRTADDEQQFYIKIDEILRLLNDNILCIVFMENKMRYEALQQCNLMDESDEKIPKNLISNCPSDHPHLQPLLQLILLLFRFREQPPENGEIVGYTTIQYIKPSDNMKLLFFDVFIGEQRLDILFKCIFDVYSKGAIDRASIGEICADIKGFSGISKRFIEFLNIVTECTIALKCYTYDNPIDNPDENMIMFIIFDYILRYLPFFKYPEEKNKVDIFDKINLDIYDEQKNINDLIKGYLYTSIIPFFWRNVGEKWVGTCVETTILNILMNLFYKLESGMIEVPESSEQSLKDFFMEHSYDALKNDTLNTIGNQWVELLSNREGMIYQLNGYELLGKSIGNMLVRLIESKQETIPSTPFQTVYKFLIKYTNSEDVQSNSGDLHTNSGDVRTKETTIEFKKVNKILITDDHCEMLPINTREYNGSLDINNIFFICLSDKNFSNMREHLLLNNIAIIYNIMDQKHMDTILSTIDPTKKVIIRKSNKFSGQLSLSDNVICIYRGAFQDSKKLLTVEGGDFIELIDDNAFKYSRIRAVVIGKRVKIIGNWAFSSCGSMNGAFFGYGSMHGPLIIPDSVVTIGTGAFYLCQSITGLVIGNHVKHISAKAFGLCTKLTGQLIIPDSVVIIGGGAFAMCRSIIGLQINGNVKFYGKEHFTGCNTNVTSQFAKYMVDHKIP